MGKSCCGGKEESLQKVPKTQIWTLWAVLAINLVMFAVEYGASFFGHSLALSSDSFDMLGDAVAYAATLYVVNLGITAKRKAAQLKGWIILASAALIIASAIYRTFTLKPPHVEAMTYVGTLALLANLVCLALLTKFRKSDINMASVWLCSRNDIIANTSVLVAAGMVHLTKTPWPDLVVGFLLGMLFIKSALHIFSESKQELSTHAA